MLVILIIVAAVLVVVAGAVRAVGCLGARTSVGRESCLLLFLGLGQVELLACLVAAIAQFQVAQLLDEGSKVELFLALLLQA